MDRNEFLLFILIFSLSAFLEIYLATEAQSPEMILKVYRQTVCWDLTNSLLNSMPFPSSTIIMYLLSDQCSQL